VKTVTTRGNEEKKTENVVMKTSDERPTKKRRTIPDNDFACEHSQGATYRCNYCHGFACVNCIAGIGDRDDLFNEHAPRDIDLEFHQLDLQTL